MPGVARDTHDCDSASEEEVSLCLCICVVVVVGGILGCLLWLLGSLVRRDFGGRRVCGTTQRQFIEIFGLNVRIDAIDSGLYIPGDF